MKHKSKKLGGGKLFSLFIKYIVALAVLFGGLCCITGEKQKGSQILVNCFTSAVLYLIILQMFNTEVSHDCLFSSGLPIVNHVRQYGNIKNFMTDCPSIFAMDFVEMVTLVIMFQWISGLISFPDAGIAGKITSRIVIVCISIILYGYFMSFVRNNIIIKWCVYCVECIITGGSIFYTPAMLLSTISGLKKNNFAITYFISAFSKTALGKAISSSAISVIVFIVFVMALESQYGSVCTVIKNGVEFIEYAGGIVVSFMGLFILIKCIKLKSI